MRGGVTVGMLIQSVCSCKTGQQWADDKSRGITKKMYEQGERKGYDLFQGVPQCADGTLET